MIVCVNCRKEMKCTKTGIGVNFEHGHVYAGDQFTCPICKTKIIATNIEATYDPDYNKEDEYLDINK